MPKPAGEWIKFSGLCLLLGSVFVLAGYRNYSIPKMDPQVMDISFVTGEPCQPPCWQGLELNQPVEDVEAFLAELPFVEAESIKTWDGVTMSGISNATEISYTCKQSRVNICGLVILSDGVLKGTSHNIYYHLPLKTVIDKFGPPSSVIYTPATSHGDGCNMDLEYPDADMIISISNRHDERICLNIQNGKAFDPDTGVTDVSYIVWEEFIPDRCQKLPCVPWPGFKTK